MGGAFCRIEDSRTRGAGRRLALSFRQGISNQEMRIPAAKMKKRRLKNAFPGLPVWKRALAIYHLPKLNALIASNLPAIGEFIF